MIYVKVGSLNKFRCVCRYFRGLVNLTGLSRLKYNVSCRFVTIDITAAQHGSFNALSLSLEAMPLVRSNFFSDTELYRQIIYPEYIPYNMVKAKK